MTHFDPGERGAPNPGGRRPLHLPLLVLASQHSYYDSGLEESETPSSKSSSGPRLGPLALPEDHYERTTPDGSIGEMEHPENGEGRWHGQAPQE